MEPGENAPDLYRELLDELGDSTDQLGETAGYAEPTPLKEPHVQAGVNHIGVQEPSTHQDGVKSGHPHATDNDLTPAAPRPLTRKRSTGVRSPSYIPDGYEKVVETTWGLVIGQSLQGELYVAKYDRNGRLTTYSPSRMGELVLGIAASIAPDSISFDALRRQIITTYSISVNTSELHAALDGLQGIFGNRGARWQDFGKGGGRTIALSGVIKEIRVQRPDSRGRRKS